MGAQMRYLDNIAVVGQAFDKGFAFSEGFAGRGIAVMAAYLDHRSLNFF